ncbi:LuxR C-terminal-related transcriptional regulator [Aureimonas sp. AU20]|uniref:LuxR C-terminal-related transcriptional regulator n=1 Tax=Aureimonas sp. AU20 TaxID=1349819 RepID=UPI0012E3F436|nr:LuxR C-terminal-related transcriptional regulator [Aureimonas sp. AU20]
MRAVSSLAHGRSDRFRPPRRAAGSLERRQLVARVLAGLDGQIVLVQAPAGYGKTELLSSGFESLRSAGEQVVWLTADTRNGAAFANELAQAAGFTDLAADPGLSLDRILDALVAIPAPRVTIFLDGFARDYEGLASLLAALPDKLRVVVSMRATPSAPLSRFRMRGLLAEIGADDLAFARNEMRHLCGSLAPGDLETLQLATRGWPALVKLIVPRLAGAIDPHERSRLLSGLHGDIRTFLREEILSGWTADIRELLLAAAILDEIHPAFACRLAGLDETRAAERLEALYPIVAPLAERPGWFLLHPLVRGVLALDLPAALVKTRHSQAAALFASDGQIVKAVHHAGKAEDFGFAANTIRAAGGVDLFLRAGYTVLRRLLDGLPPSVVHASPGLRLCAALVMAKEGQIRAAREALDELKGLTGEDAEAELPEQVLVHIDCLFDAYEDRHLGDEQIDWLEARLRSYRLKDTWERGWLHNHLCIAHTRRGGLRQARIHAVKALDCYREEGAAYAQTFMLIHLALVNLLGGRLAAAATYARQAEDLVQRTQWTDENLLAIARIPMAEILYRQGHVRAADAMLAEALPIVSRGEGWVDVYTRGFVTFARCRYRLGGVEAALRVADDARDVAEDRGLPRLRLVADILRVETLTSALMLSPAREAAAALPDPERDEGWPARRQQRDGQVTLARLRLRGGDAAGARADLLAFLAGAREEDDALSGLTAQILLAEAAFSCGDAEAARLHLERATQLAKPQDLLEPFVFEGEPFRETVRGMVRRWGLSAFEQDSAAFLNRILATGEDGGLRPREGLLSVREADVLSLLAQGLSNKEIARELGVTEATAKFHLKNLFAKLGASRRTMAVSLARAMGLLGGAPETHIAHAGD